MAMRVQMELNEKVLVQLVHDYIKAQLGEVDIKAEDIHIEVITKENYRAEKWERGRFRATVDRLITK